MKIYPETLTNLAYCHEWITTQAIAEQRGRMNMTATKDGTPSRSTQHQERSDGYSRT